jgi:peptide/nickel transport system substrate-binding protein
MRTLAQRMLLFSWISALTVLLAACNVGNAPQDQPSAGSSDNVLRIDADHAFGPFCPYALECSGSTYVFPFIYSLLFIPNPEGELEPDLAVAWNYDPKTYTWRIRLREDARFHNGEPVTADDVAYSISACTEKLQKALREKIKNVKVGDDYGLEIQMKQSDPFFLESIWDLDIIPDPNRHANLDSNDFPIGSGPFQFAGRGDDGSVILRANDDYYNGRPAVDRVVLYYMPRREDSWVRLINGHTDIVGNLAFQDYEIIKQYEDRFYFSKSPYHYYSILLYNTHHPLFENPLVRRALTHAIDRNYIVNNILNGMADVVAGPMGNQSVWHDPDLKPLLYDPALALNMLEKAGWSTDPQTKSLVKNGKPFAFELLLPSGSKPDLRIARFIKLQLNEVGIRVHLKALPYSELVERYHQNTAFDSVLIKLSASDRRPDVALKAWGALDDTLSTAGGFDSPEAASLGRMALTANDLETRKVLFQQFNHLISDLQPGTFLFQETYIDAMSKRFTLDHPFYIDYSIGYKMQFARLKNEGKR